MNEKKPLIIFEMANNHQGVVSHGKKIISKASKVAKEFGLRAAIKFQFRHLETFIHDAFKGSDYVKHIKRFESTRLSINDFKELIDYARKNGLEVISTPFDETSVNTCLDLDVDYIKVASASSDDWPLLEVISQAKKPIIISTGGKTLREIDRVYNFMLHRNVEFSLLHCVSEYPTNPENLQLDFIDIIKKRYKVDIGYSGHENPDNHYPSIIALSKGAHILERHIGVETSDIKLNKYSLNPDQIHDWLKAVSDTLTQMKLPNESNKSITKAESDALIILKRGVYAKRELNPNTIISKKDVYFSMPIQPGQMASSEFYDEIKIEKKHAKDSPVMEIAQRTNLFKVRDYIHSAKAILNQSGLEIGDNFNVELSHHYGMNRFSEVGATIINLINREYCKKLIIVLPNQEHPCHFHKIKEETFQLLYGDLTLYLNEVKYELKPGEIITIKRNDKHSFYSKNGAVFEEISTTHHIGDSYYCDINIQNKDLIDRKTFIESW